MSSLIEHADRLEREQARHERIEESLVRAYSAAMAACHSSKSVSIHAGTDVVEWLKAQVVAKIDGDQQPWAVPENPTLWGFPLIPEPDWGTEAITVDTREIIA